MKAAALAPNEDVYVQVTDPMFDGQVKRVRFSAPEPSEDNGVESVRLSFTILEEIEDTTKVKHAPGKVVSPYPRKFRVLSGATLEAKVQEQVNRDARQLFFDLQNLGLIPAGRYNPTTKQFYNALAQVEGKEALCNFTVTTGANRSFQNFKFSAAGGAAGAAAASENY